MNILTVRFQYKADIHYINSMVRIVIYFNVSFPAKADIKYPIKNSAENEPVDSLYIGPLMKNFDESLFGKIQHKKATVERISINIQIRMLKTATLKTL